MTRIYNIVYLSDPHGRIVAHGEIGLETGFEYDTNVVALKPTDPKCKRRANSLNSRAFLHFDGISTEKRRSHLLSEGICWPKQVRRLDS
jgi:hypothetical protein